MKMLNSNTHPEDALLASYSAASLPLSQALCVSIHIEHCDDCKQKTLQLDQLGSELMLQLEPAPAAAGLKQALLDRIDSLEYAPGNTFEHQPGIMLGTLKLDLQFQKAP